MKDFFICDFDTWAFLGYGDVGSFLCKLCHLLSGSYWKHHVSSPVSIWRTLLDGQNPNADPIPVLWQHVYVSCIANILEILTVPLRMDIIKISKTSTIQPTFTWCLHWETWSTEALNHCQILKSSTIQSCYNKVSENGSIFLKVTVGRRQKHTIHLPKGGPIVSVTA